MPADAPFDPAAFLEPLARAAAADPDLEGLVIWAGEAGWPAPTAAAEALEAEEIAFYAEGLLEEGFGVIWEILSLPDAPEQARAIRLLVWQGEAAPPPAAPAPWRLLDRGERAPA
jgi:hypothetical protein